MGVKIINLEQRQRLDKELEELKRKRGQLITWALEIEELLEGILSRYFRKGTTGEDIEFFETEILRNLSFEQKIQIFEKVIKKEGYDAQKIHIIKKAIKEVQNARNKAGHWRVLAFLESGKVVLRRKHELESRGMLDLDERMLKNIEHSKEVAFQKILEFHQWFHSKPKSLV